MNSEITEVAIIGAGPYGLSIAAHLRRAGVPHRVFGRPMGLWRDHMPDGMILKSQGFASNLSAPGGVDSLADFCRTSGREYADRRHPVPLDTFLGYAQWFQRRHVPEVEPVLVGRVEGAAGGFELTLADGSALRANSVVVAIGVAAFAHLPALLSGVDPARVGHTSAHRDLSAFRGRDVVVLGAGQSALETAALLHEQGAAVRLVARTPRLLWNGPPLEPDRPVRERLREPEAGLGSGWATWFYSGHPRWYRWLPAGQRVYRARTALGPAGAYWLRERLEGKVPTLLGRLPVSVAAVDGGVRLVALNGDGRPAEIVTEHLIAGTGYRPDLDRLDFIGSQLRQRVRTVAATPAVNARYESSVPGLYFTGPLVAPTFGPVMRFVFGADHAARTISDAVRRRGRRRAPGAASGRDLLDRVGGR